jgi:S1-C subfamily serine protease
MGTMNSAGYGVITATTGQASDADANYKLLQTDINGSPLASGVLFNLYGQLIGVITNEHSAIGMENLITAYGITDMKKRMEKLSNDQPFAYLGIYGTSVNVSIHEELNVPYGAYVKDVVFDSPAMRAGILQGDLIVQIDETEISTFSDYMAAIYKKNPEETIRVTILRQAMNGYKEMNMNIVLGERK